MISTLGNIAAALFVLQGTIMILPLIILGKIIRAFK